MTVRGVPEDVIKKLRKVAAEEGRSVSEQAIVWLEQAAKEWRERLNLERALVRQNRAAMRRLKSLRTARKETRR